MIVKGHMSKIQTSKHAKPQVTQHRFKSGVASSSGCTYNLLPPDRLREEAEIQVEVENRLRQLRKILNQVLKKIKSQRGGSVEVVVNSKVKWPHEFVLSGLNKDSVSYNQLSPNGWLASAGLSGRSQTCKLKKIC